MPDEGAPRFSANAATILSTEHWSLLGLRSMSWTESFTRTGLFLNTLSASIVALALVADATGFGRLFTMFAAVLFPIVLLVGLSTYARLVQINVDDIYIVQAMNLLRRGYVDIAPEVEPYLTSGHTTDLPGLWASMHMGRRSPKSHWPHVLVTTPTVVATLDAIVAAAGAGFLAARAGMPSWAVAAVAAAVLVGVLAALMVVQGRAGIKALGEVGASGSQS